MDVGMVMQDDAHLDAAFEVLTAENMAAMADELTSAIKPGMGAMDVLSALHASE